MVEQPLELSGTKDLSHDDDIDFEIDRENYNKLCEVGMKEFKYPYFFRPNIQIQVLCADMFRSED